MNCSCQTIQANRWSATYHYDVVCNLVSKKHCLPPYTFWEIFAARQMVNSILWIQIIFLTDNKSLPIQYNVERLKVAMMWKSFLIEQNFVQLRSSRFFLWLTDKSNIHLFENNLCNLTPTKYHTKRQLLPFSSLKANAQFTFQFLTTENCIQHEIWWSDQRVHPFF